MALNDMSKTLADKVAVHLNLPFELEPDLQLHSITVQMMVQIVDMTDNAILQEIINYAKENKICDVYLLDKKFVKEALEKQIPKKPYEETIATEEGYMTKKRNFFYCCPNCFYHLNENQKHCDDCGQALDWSDTE